MHDYFSSRLDSEDPVFGIVLIARLRSRTRCLRTHCIVLDACRWIVADHSCCHAAVRLHACDSAACLQFGCMHADRCAVMQHACCMHASCVLQCSGIVARSCA